MGKVLWHVVVGVLGAASVVAASGITDSANRALGTLEVTESECGPPAALPMSTAERLREMSAAERSNARLSLEGVGALAEVERHQALQVEALWAEGRHDEAIGVLSQLEAGGVRLVAAIAWRQPVASQPKSLFNDARIGDTRVGAADVALDFDWATGNLFAVVAWAGSVPGWTVNISTDGGVTWVETYYWSLNAPVDAAVVDQYLYVAYAPPNEPGMARMRRFLVDDGAVDAVYGYQTVANVSPNTILDVSAGANAEYTNNRIYCYFIESDNALRYFWADAAGTPWTDNSPPISNAESSLDYHWSGGTDYHSWITYWGTDGTGHVLGRGWAGGWSAPHALPTPTSNRVRVSAFGDNVFVSYQDDWAGAGRLSASYDVTYDEGASWSSGDAYVPDPGEPNCYGMDITARGGWGSVAVWNVEDSFDTVFVASREDYEPEVWNEPIGFNQFDAYSGGPSFIQYLGSLEAVGMVYLAGSTGSDAIPYFDRIGLLPFGDGFEFGDTSAWSATVE